MSEEEWLMVFFGGLGLAMGGLLGILGACIGCAVALLAVVILNVYARRELRALDGASDATD